MLLAALLAELMDTTLPGAAPARRLTEREAMAALRLALRAALSPPVGMLRGEPPLGLLAEE